MFDDRTRNQVASELRLLPYDELSAMERRYEWILTARPDQLPPEEYFVWMLMGGRGSGKTRAGAEDTWWPAYVEPQRIALVGPTNNDVRKTCFEGESGLLARIPEHLIINYNRTSLELWVRTRTGGESYYVGYSAEEPERLRGPQHHRAWCDELGAWDPKKAEDTWDNLMFGLRLGSHPTVLVTTTPRPRPMIRKIIEDPSTVVSRASTYDNADHLPKSVLEQFRKKYEGTRLGRQELDAELLDDVVGALWIPESVLYLDDDDPCDELLSVVVAVDPSGSPNGDEVGIVVAGKRSEDEFVVLEDSSVQGSPAEWARAAVRAYEKYQADCIVAEVNFGGAMVESTIRNVSENVSFRAVRASRGKVVRAEPIAALYEQGRVLHRRGLQKLEDQMLQMTGEGYVGSGSPDRVDALVWALTHLSGGRRRRDQTNLSLEGERQSNDARM